MPGKPRIAIVTPFLDKRHGTERCVAEQVERLASDYEIHVYSNRLEDVDPGKIVWHRVPALPGPHLFAYGWWIIANHWYRWRDRRFRGLKYDLTYTPGINCFDADVISVHIVFAEYYSRVRRALGFRGNPVRSWPQLLHRRIYYRLVIALERMIYGWGKAVLTVVSARVGRALERYGRGRSHLVVIVHGIDVQRFNVETRQRLRDSARSRLGLKESDFCLLLIGNDWINKGLPCLLEALARLEAASVRLLVVGRDTAEPYRETIEWLHMEDRVMFLPVRPDVEIYYAAADLYVGPSLEDAFGLPPLEAMACGVPCIVSRQTGVSGIVTPGVEGFVLEDPQDSDKLANLIARLFASRRLRELMGVAATQTAQKYTWDRNARQLDQVFRDVLQRKGSEPVAVASEQSTR